jgi:hypothetical protein
MVDTWRQSNSLGVPNISVKQRWATMSKRSTYGFESVIGGDRMSFVKISYKLSNYAMLGLQTILQS